MLLQRILCAVFIYNIMIEVSSYSGFGPHHHPKKRLGSKTAQGDPTDEANPVPYVVYPSQPRTRRLQYEREDCVKAMQWMADFHQNNRSWADGIAAATRPAATAHLRGKGWSRVGAHVPIYNNISIGICLIGDWM
ncbi:hypothetical protein NQ317_002951, partial [Molorchus minor]